MQWCSDALEMLVFERAKGDFTLRLGRRDPGARIKSTALPLTVSRRAIGKSVPRHGENNHSLLRGGEKVFRYFIEQMSDENMSTPVTDTICTRC